MFKNKTVLILGGTGSIGTVIADTFEKEGARVYRHGLHKGECNADVRKKGEMEQLIQKISDQCGGINVLVNAVSAPMIITRFEKKEWSDFFNHLNTQLKAAVETAHLVIPLMRKQNKGRIIHILTTSVDGKTPSHLSDYLTAKYALWGLTKALAKELGRYNITVNAVSPGIIENTFTQGFPSKLKEIAIHETPLGRLTTEQDVADVILFLASDKGQFITGENIQVAGGSNL